MNIVGDIHSGTLLDEIDRHFRVLAGPGAGKTYWLVQHIRQVIRKSTRLSGVARVACISYTNAAVGEIVERLGAAAAQVEVSTIHSFLYCNVVKPYLHILRDREGRHLVPPGQVDGHDKHHPNYQKVNEWVRTNDAAWLMQAAFKEQFSILMMRLQELVWRRSAAGWTLQPRRTDRMGPKLKALCTSDNLAAYKALYWREGTIDHEDVLHFAYRILEEHPALREFLAARFRYLFIDEFQDTLPVQAKMVEWLAEAGTIVGVIGDSEQSIFGFLGTTPEHFHSFAFPGFADYHIRGNRRSTGRIVELLNRVRADGLVQNSLRSVDGDPVRVYVGEVEQVVPAVQQALATRSSVRVLARTNDQVHRIRRCLTPYVGEPWKSFLEADKDRARFMERVIGAIELGRFGNFSRALRYLVPGFGRKGTFRSPLEFDEPVTELQRRGLAVSLLEYALSHYANLTQGTLLQVYDCVGQQLKTALPGLHLTKVMRTGKFAAFAQATPFSVLASTVALDEEIREVRTIHLAKGTEAESVLVCLDSREQLGHLLTPEASINPEERRMTYVALSRAKDQLSISVPPASCPNPAALSALGLQVTQIPQP